MTWYDIVIPLVTVAVAWLGSRFTARSVNTWYRTIRKPRWTPPGAVIGAVWTVLYILAAASALIVWSLPAGPPPFVALLFTANAVINVLWSYVFFARERMFAAIWVCLTLDVTIVALIEFIAPVSMPAAWLLVPYAAWVTFASYLNYRVWLMNAHPRQMVY
jgi:tryptophan-rich sensory protein